MRITRSLLLALIVLASPAWAHPTVLCAIGDSLVSGGPIISGNPGWPSWLASRRSGENFAVINGGVGGYTAVQTKALYESDFQGKGCTHAAILVCTNDLASSMSAASCFATLQALVAEMRADTSGRPNGINVTVLTLPPRGGSGGWNGTMETQRGLLRTSILAMSDVTPVDLEGMAGTGSPVEMAVAYRAADMLHFNGTLVTGGTVKVADLVDAAVSW